ncbi:MAG: hypothetical protein RQ745_10875 [Longimicrobiales bacterium]|nr:hypothetical protein [Longimicrobiales bacterium]
MALRIADSFTVSLAPPHSGDDVTNLCRVCSSANSGRRFERNYVTLWSLHKSTKIPINVELASTTAVAALDESFFRVRFDRLTPSEKRYLRAMAELGPGPHRSGDVSAVLERKVTSLGPVRANLIAKGMIWS